MKTLHEAAQMALDALQKCVKLTDEPYDAIDALREALADKPEPVAWYLPSPGGDDSIFRDHRTVIACNGNKWEGFLPLYAAPAASVPLTDSELAKIAVEDEFLLYCDQDSFNEIARAIEAAHRITGASK